jgi:mono/diheme cytochrome c family protein
MGALHEGFAKSVTHHHNKHLPSLQKTRPRHTGLFGMVCFAGAALFVTFAGTGCHSSADATRPPLNAEEQRGKLVYDARCASCHDAYSGKPRQGPGLAGVFRKKYLPSGLPANDDRAREAILTGRRTMPGFQNALDEQQVNDLMAYLHTL